MKPAPFAYHAVETVEEAVATLAELGEDARVLAGGQSLVPMLNLRLARPSALVDVGRVASLSGISANGALRLGATTRQADALRSAQVVERAPLLTEALRHVGHPATRSRGTIGGSIAHADPAAELPAVLLALDGQVTARSGKGERTIPAASLFLGPFTTALAGGELLTELRLPDPPAGARHGFAEIARRRGDFALAGAAVVIAPGYARVALFAVAPAAFRAEAAERALAQGAGAEVAAELAAAAAEPAGDEHATAAYRAGAARVATLRALLAAGVARE
ncbi:MAG: aerobic carbon-monoxide dehydrogenase medium subunit [Gaiellales bacterium]|nr:aerobic carbon-monoxide dehydrogenase medium subunit [Gaiellales bacterium]